MAWLDALRPSLDKIDDAMWASWNDLDKDLSRIVVANPETKSRPNRSAWLRAVRRRLVAHQATRGVDPVLWQAGAQFVAGYYDLDLREATGAGHGAMILSHAPKQIAQFWKQRLSKGGLIGIAATEAHGGSRIQEITTAAREESTDGWRVTGEKCWGLASPNPTLS